MRVSLQQVQNYTPQQIEKDTRKIQYREFSSGCTTQSRIISTVRGAHSQLWGTIIPVCPLYAARKYDRRFWHTNCLIYRVKLDLYAERLIYKEKECLYAERNGHFPY